MSNPTNQTTPKPGTVTAKLLRSRCKSSTESLKRIDSFLEKFDRESKDIFALQVRLDRLPEIGERFHSAIKDYDDFQQDGDHSSLIDEFESLFYTVKAKILSLMQDIKVKNETKTPNSTSNQSQSEVRPSPNSPSLLQLARLKLPEFDGLYSQWLNFRDMFRSLVHDDQTIPIIFKFHQLKSLLRGEPANLIQSIEVSIDNYEKVWELLCKRYDNSKLIIQSHIHEIFNLPKIESNAKSLRNFWLTFNKNLRALSSLGQPIDKWDTLIIHIACSKFDKSTLRAWEEYSVVHSPNDFDYSVLEQFLDNRCVFLEAYESQIDTSNLVKSVKPYDRSNQYQSPSQSNQRKSPYNQNKSSSKLCMLNNYSSDSVCPHCQGSHAIFYCETFKNKSVSARKQIIQKLKLCSNCFSSKHSEIQSCPSTSTCRVCCSKHNTLLHEDNTNQTATSSSSRASVRSAVTQGNSAFLSSADHLHVDFPISSNVTLSSSATSTCLNSTQILLPTALITIYDHADDPHDFRVILDSGSQLNLLNEKMATLLNLPRSTTGAPIQGINGIETTSSSFISAKIASRISNYNTKLDFQVIPTISVHHIPIRSFKLENLSLPNYIISHLADPIFNSARPVDGLIGTQSFFEIMFHYNSQFHKIDNLYFCKSKFGWIVSGSVPFKIPHPRQCFMTVYCAEQYSIKNLPQHNSDSLDHFEEEELTSVPSKAQSFCENHFQETVARNSDGRFIVGLPFKESPSLLGDSYLCAKKSFLALEKRFQRDPTLFKEYAEFINEYEKLAHMSKIPESEITRQPNFYLPHHPVFKNSSTTKLRVVFNASAKSTSGKSLNDILQSAQPIQEPLYSIILRFRLYKFVITADVAKMYRQVLIRDPDQEFQRIVWRNSPSEELSHYRLHTVTYGEASAPFLATRCLQQLALDCSDSMVSTVIKNDFYIDDLSTGSDDINQIQYVQKEISFILCQAGMQLRKWCSNDYRVLDFIPPDDDPHHIIRFSESKESLSTLGLIWNPQADCLSFQMSDSFRQSHFTKRSILSDLSKIFDPLGLVTPVLIRGKIFIQELWQSNSDWDEVLPENLQIKWHKFSTQLSDMKKLSIPRRACFNSINFELHGFSDASESAYGACIYIKSFDEYGHFQSNILTSKSRVAPMKTISLPRLELCAAVLLVRLMASVLKSLRAAPSTIHYWTDSEIVLTWIGGEPCQFKTFIANRVTEIQHNSVSNQWRYVNTKTNPADLVSRGVNPRELIQNPLWWYGPHWLTLDTIHWPGSQNFNLPADSDVFELKPVKYSLLNTQTTSDFDNFMSRFSSLQMLVAVTAYIRRYLYNLQHKINKSSEPVSVLTVAERREALNFLLRRVQHQEFPKELIFLQSNKPLPPKNRLLSLNPFFHSPTGLIRVGGRLSNSSFSFDKKHPILLPAKHTITTLIFRYYHVSHLHIGAQSLLALVRNMYWPLNGRNGARMIIHKCIVCYKAKPRTHDQMMANLPSIRVTPARPFEHTGIDFCGPVYITHGLRKKVKVKAYIAVFVCMVVRAIHLELVSDLSSAAFLASFRRFVSRRGLCAHVYSDNGTNFIGADRELKRLFQNYRTSSDFQNYTSRNEITWHFNPPNAPHFGGIWEAAVKSTKHHLVRVIGNASLSFEEMATFLCQIEACLNSRPIHPSSADPNDFNALTPAHFLVGGILTLPPDSDYAGIPANRLRRWELIQSRLQDFWKRWSTEFISNHQQRPKWLKPSPNFSVGSLVIVREPNLPPLQWKLARISHVFPGTDGLIRVATVKLPDGSFLKRPVNRLCLLPMDDDEL